ncbi:MAG TPA: hypothetical protein ENI69_06555 [Rhodospirillales bacterium]|nr:hypothetical protein [Rhodospirillales bacterium]
MSRDVLARQALRQIATLLTLLDRNRHSPTYGCFDRNYWHYRMIDFPSGMAQEFVLPLALAWSLDIPGNPYYRDPSLRDWVEAGILYAAKSAHGDGSCDDYFPYERAGGAAAFSLLACLDAAEIIGLDHPLARDFFDKRATWLAGHQESGRLSNHQALIALCLELAGRALGTDRWNTAATDRLAQVLSWQTDEGWFWEYEGCDPGYLTLTISILARLQQINPSPQLAEALARAVKFAAHFVHPDGSFGGEYGSRNTYNFFPHGFELIGEQNPDALAINDLFLKGLENGKGPCYADDHIIGHHTWNYLLAWRDFRPNRPAPLERQQGRTYFTEAKLLIERRGQTTLFAALNKGGVFKAFDGDKLICSDTQFSVQALGRNAVGHLIDDYKADLSEDTIAISGSLGWAKQTRMTTVNLIGLRTVMFTLGRFFPNLIRRLLQGLLITGKKAAPYAFQRTFVWTGEQLRVEDELSATSWAGVTDVALGSDQTSIYVVMSRTFQCGQMLPWINLREALNDLEPGEPLKLTRTLPDHHSEA